MIPAFEVLRPDPETGAGNRCGRPTRAYSGRPSPAAEAQDVARTSSQRVPAAIYPRGLPSFSSTAEPRRPPTRPSTHRPRSTAFVATTKREESPEASARSKSMSCPKKLPYIMPTAYAQAAIKYSRPSDRRRRSLARATASRVPAMTSSRIAGHSCQRPKRRQTSTRRKNGHRT